MTYRKIRRLIAIYAIAGATVLGLFSLVCYDRLQVYRRQTGYDASRAFEETVGAIDRLSRSLEKSLYAADGGMCARVCAEAYADARTAETALAALPFSTIEHERVKSYLGLVEDYAYTLCREAAEQGFTDEQRQTLTSLSERATEMAERVRQMQGGVNDGLIEMDSREAQLANIGLEDRRLLSDEMGDYAAGFAELEPLRYDGRYTARDEAADEPVDERATREAAAKLLGVEPDTLELTAEYAGGARRCYTLGSVSVCAGAQGVETLSDSRLVSRSTMDDKTGENAARRVLQKLGCGEMTLTDSRRSGALLELSYACAEGDVTCLDRTVKLTIALDNGSLYALDLRSYGQEQGREWPISADEASALLPAGLTLQDVRQVTMASPGGESVACYELSCTGEQDRVVRVYIRADTGRQQEIEIG